jgi:NifU-like protein involved in Fe-S cluster formation
VGTDLVGEPECGGVMDLQMKINFETQVIMDHCRRRGEPKWHR